MDRGVIHITHHARLRLAERVPEITSKNIDAFVSAARYNGESFAELKWNNTPAAQYVRERYRNRRGSTVRLYRGILFLFSGNKARTLVTVIRLDHPEDFAAE